MKLSVAVILSVIGIASTNPIEQKRNASPLIESGAVSNMATTCLDVGFGGTCTTWAFDGDSSGCQWVGQRNQVDNISSLKVERNYVCRFYDESCSSYICLPCSYSV
jgi:hypothetical protein